MKHLHLCWLALLAGCGLSPERYQQQQPPLQLEQYLNGPLIAVGTVSDWRGAVSRRLCVELDGQWQDGVGTLDEQFYFDDGERQQRIWTIRASAEGYSGTAADIKGEALGVVGGFAMNWQYAMDLQVGDDQYSVTFDDWLYQLDEVHLLNRAAIRKFGLQVGEVTLLFIRGQSQCPPSWRTNAAANAAR